MHIAPSSLHAKRRFKFAERVRWQFPLPPLSAWLLRDGEFNPDYAAMLSHQVGANSKLRSSIMRWYNSPIFNWSRPFDSLEAAGLVVDPRHQVRIAFLAEVGCLVGGHANFGGYCRESLWRHCVCVGATASLLSRITGKGDFLDALIAGTLHDIGVLIAERLVPTRFRRWIAEIELGVPADVCVEATIEANPREIAAIVLEQWGVSEAIVALVRHQQEIHRFGFGTKAAQTASCVLMANYLCCKTDVGGGLFVERAEKPAPVIFETLHFSTRMERIAEANLPALMRACLEI